MSAAKHTPGPWFVKAWTEHDSDGAIESCGDQVVARQPNGDEVGIFTVALEGESLADLHLIAAAPDLLEALQEAARALRMLGHTDVVGYRLAMLAIAKAAGGAL